MPEGRPKSSFEPAMISSVEHLKKDDLQFDVDAEMVRLKTSKNGEEVSSRPRARSGRSKNPDPSPKLG